MDAAELTVVGGDLLVEMKACWWSKRRLLGGLWKSIILLKDGDRRIITILINDVLV